MAAPGDPGEVMLRPTLVDGLRGYERRTWAAAERLAATGPSRGVVTFQKPLQHRDLADLANAGLALEAVEALARDRATGELVSLGTAFGDGLDARLATIADARDADVLGVIAADVEVTSRDVVRAVRRDSRVRLLDLLQEEFARHRPDVTDIVNNDIYWLASGLG